MVPIGAIHDKSDRESDFRVIPKIREDKTLFSMRLSNARLGIIQIWKRTKKNSIPHFGTIPGLFKIPESFQNNG